MNQTSQLESEILRVGALRAALDERLRLHFLDTSTYTYQILNSLGRAAKPVRLSPDELFQVQRERAQVNAEYWTAVREYHKSRFGRSYDWIDKAYWEAHTIAASQRAAFSPAAFLSEDEKQASEDSGVPLDTL